MKSLGAAIVLIVALSGVWIFFNGATERRLVDLIETTAEYSEISDVSIRFAGRPSSRTVPCDADVPFFEREEFDYRAWRGQFTAPEFDYRVAATRAADRFEAEGWEVQRSIPDPEGAVTLDWLVEAVRDDELVLGSYAAQGTFSFSATIFACPMLDDDRFRRILVDEFPAVE